MRDCPHLLRCSATYTEDSVDRLLGHIFTNGSGRTADVLYSVLLLCILLIYPLQPGRGRICNHVPLIHSASSRRDVPTLSDSNESGFYNNDFSRIVVIVA